MKSKGIRKERKKDKPISWKWRLPFILILPLSIILQFIASKMPTVVNDAYSQTSYPLLLKIITFMTGWFPFSLFEFLIFLIIIWGLVLELRALWQILKKRRSLRNALLHGAVNTLAIVGLAYGLFLFLFGFNYQRTSFAETAGFDTTSPSTAELKLLCESLVTQANILRQHIQEDERGVMLLKDSRWDALKRAPLGFQKLSQKYKVIDNFHVARPKGIIFSSLWSYVGLSGLYSPFTGEPNINMAIPHHNLAFTSCHEMAHQIGFAAEDEANFIGYLACRMHPDNDFQYSGTLIAMRYALRALNRVDQDSYSALRSSLSEGIERDQKAEYDFWMRYRTPARKVARRVNDAYLKSQGQEEGVASYGKVIDLLIAEQRSQEAENQDQDFAP
jgi:hypothetical protein